MLAVIHDAKAKRVAQATLEKNLKAALEREGRKNIGFPGGNFDRTIYSAGDKKLWCAFSYEPKEYAVARYWNGFGIYNTDRPAQTIVVEINIPTNSNSAVVAGFFAEDSETGDIFLMHSGRIGGGRAGIGKAAFLVWSKTKRVDVTSEDGSIRSGIAVGKLNDPDLAGASGASSGWYTASKRKRRSASWKPQNSSTGSKSLICTAGNFLARKMVGAAVHSSI